MNFFAELKRRHVDKVALVYAVVAWLLIAVASILLPIFEAPGWMRKAFVLLLALGFAFAVFVSWNFEMTPEGLKRTQDLSPGPARDRFVRLDLGFEFDSFRRDLERPGQNQRHRKTEDDDDDKYLHHPRRRVESRQENRRSLNQEPRNDRVGNSNFVNVAPLQLGEEVHWQVKASGPRSGVG